jgi:hypothetical protein
MLAKATAAWGTQMPAWVKALAEACDGSLVLKAKIAAENSLHNPVPFPDRRRDLFLQGFELLVRFLVGQPARFIRRQIAQPYRHLSYG